MDIRKLDLNFQGLPDVISSFLIVGPGGPILIETGPGSTTQALTRALAEHGYEPADIRHVLLTHIHLDHAGAAGWWARQGARIYVHHVGAPHLIDPSKLLVSATRIYGDQMDRLWGEVLPVPADCLTVLSDGDTVAVAGLKLKAIDTPGHARHHMVYRLEDIGFTGDVAAIHLGDSDFISLPTPPPEFELEAWRASLARMRDERFRVLLPTHCCPIERVPEHLDELDELLGQAVGLVQGWMDEGIERDEMVRRYEAWNHERALAQGVPADRLSQYDAANPLFMSVDGLLRYWRKRPTTA